MDYQMPKVEVGDVVLFYLSGSASEPPMPAIVCHVGERTLSLGVIGRDSYALYPADGVRHLDDPLLRNNVDLQIHGAWEKTPQAKRLEAMEKVVASIMRDKK